MSIWEDDKRVYGGEGLFSTVRMVGRLLREIWGETMPWFAFYTPTTSSPIRLCMYNVHVTLKNSQWRKIKQMKPMRLCVVYWNLRRNNTPAFPFYTNIMPSSTICIDHGKDLVTSFHSKARGIQFDSFEHCWNVSYIYCTCCISTYIVLVKTDE